VVGAPEAHQGAPLDAPQPAPAEHAVELREVDVRHEEAVAKAVRERLQPLVPDLSHVEATSHEVAPAPSAVAAVAAITEAARERIFRSR
jgi:hypothetical protein